MPTLTWKPITVANPHWTECEETMIAGTAYLIGCEGDDRWFAVRQDEDGGPCFGCLARDREHARWLVEQHATHVLN